MDKTNNDFSGFIRIFLYTCSLLAMGLCGFKIYELYKEYSTYWQRVTLYFYDDTPPFTGEFAFYNGEILKEQRCQSTRRFKNGKHYRIRCIGEYSVYINKDGTEVPVNEVKKVEIE